MHGRWSDDANRNLSEGYRRYAEWKGFPWGKLTYKPLDRLPFVPTEQELDSLISSVGWTTGTVLQLLKETGPDWRGLGSKMVCGISPLSSLVLCLIRCRS